MSNFYLALFMRLLRLQNLSNYQFWFLTQRPNIMKENFKVKKYLKFYGIDIPV